MKIFTRAEWGARPPRSRYPTKARELWLHHSVGSGYDRDGDGDAGDDYMRSMQRYHMDTKGWSDIAYNFVVDPDGLEVYTGRGAGYAPGAQKGHNTGTHAICVIGDFRKQAVSQGLINRLGELVAYGHTQGWWPAAFNGGHRQAPGQSTTCPGDNLVNAIPAINKAAAAALNGGTEMSKDVVLDALHEFFGDHTIDPLPGVTRTKASRVSKLIQDSVNHTPLWAGAASDGSGLYIDRQLADSRNYRNINHLYPFIRGQHADDGFDTDDVEAVAAAVADAIQLDFSDEIVEKIGSKLVAK